MRALLDVNVLIALLDAGHASHALAMDWLVGCRGDGWASCPITQNGCIRIMSSPGYPDPLPAAMVAGRLEEAASSPEHEFWPCDMSLLDSQAFDWSYLLGHRQITDMYLLALAVHNTGRFVTFDRRIETKAVKGAREDHLFILG